MNSLLTSTIQNVGLLLEYAGVASIVIGFVIAGVTTFHRLLTKSHHGHELYRHFRQSLARSILVGLEFLVAGDIIRTVVSDLTLEGVAMLAGIVAIRIVLGLTLEAEVRGSMFRQPQETKRNVFAGRSNR